MAIKVGIAPDSWGVWFPQHEKQPQWWRCLDEMKVAGYEGCEIGPRGYMPNDDPQVLKNAMDARGLTLVGATEGGNFLDEGSVQQMLKEIDDISALLRHFPSAKYIVLLPPMYTNLETGVLEMNPELTDAEWAAYCKTSSGALTAAHRTALPACSTRMWTAMCRLKHRSNGSCMILRLISALIPATMFMAAVSRSRFTVNGLRASRTSTSRTVTWRSKPGWMKTSGRLPRL